MTRREAINSYRKDVAIMKKHFETIKNKQTDIGELKSLNECIERDELAIRALEIVDNGFCSECVGWNEVG